MYVMLFGIAMHSSDEQPKKAATPMCVTPSGMVISFSDSHPSKATAPMRVTLSGIAMLFKDRHPPKAEKPMLVTLSVREQNALRKVAIIESTVADTQYAWFHSVACNFVYF